MPLISTVNLSCFKNCFQTTDDEDEEEEDWERMCDNIDWRLKTIESWKRTSVLNLPHTVALLYCTVYVLDIFNYTYIPLFINSIYFLPIYTVISGTYPVLCIYGAGTFGMCTSFVQYIVHHPKTVNVWWNERRNAY